MGTVQNFGLDSRNERRQYNVSDANTANTLVTFSAHLAGKGIDGIWLPKGR